MSAWEDELKQIGQQTATQAVGQTQPNPNAAPWSNARLGGANWLGQFLFPRAAQVSQMQAQGQEPSIDQRLGVLGEAGNRIVAPFFGPLGFLLGGATEGVTTPGASPPQRIQSGVTQGAIEGGGALALQKVGNLLSYLNPSKGIDTTTQAIENSKQVATSAGINKPALPLIQKFRDAVMNRMGPPSGVMESDPDLLTSYGKVLNWITGENISPKTLASMDLEKYYAARNLDPNTIGNVSQNIMQRFPYTPSDTNGQLINKVATIARDVFSQANQEITPGLSGANKAYQVALLYDKYLPSALKAVTGGALAGGGLELFNLLKGGNQSQSLNNP